MLKLVVIKIVVTTLNDRFSFSEHTSGVSPVIFAFFRVKVEIYRRYIGLGCTRSALARQLI